MPDTKIPRLEQRPEARSFRVEDLLSEIKRGRIRIPGFQRLLKWKNDDRVAFFDSLYRGYPVGTLLLWKRDAQAERIVIGHFTVDAQARSDALWVVDGQQRLGSLADVLLSPSDREQTLLLLDLESQEFKYGKATEKQPPRWLPVFQLADSRSLHSWAHEHSPGDRLLDRLFDAGRRIREYEIPAYLVDAKEDSVLRVIFDRTNSSGRPLSKSEVFDALHGARSEQGTSSLRQIASNLEDLQFGRLEEDLVLRSLLSVERKDPGGKFRQIGKSDAIPAMKRTASALRRAVGFVKAEAGIPHYVLLPYKMPLATLALFFHEYPEPSARSRTLLARWLWRGTIAGELSGVDVTLRKTLSAIIPQQENQSVQNLLGTLEAREESTLSLHPFNFRYARSKLQLIFLSSLKPRHLETGAAVDIFAVCEEMGRQSATRLHAQPPKGQGRGLANVIFHPRLPPNRLRQLVCASSPEILASHSITSEAVSALQERDFSRFFDLRSNELRRRLADFIAMKTAFQHSDRPPIASLVVENP